MSQKRSNADDLRDGSVEPPIKVGKTELSDSDSDDDEALTQAVDDAELLQDEEEYVSDLQLGSPFGYMFRDLSSYEAPQPNDWVQVNWGNEFYWEQAKLVYPEHMLCFPACKP